MKNNTINQSFKRTSKRSIISSNIRKSILEIISSAEKPVSTQEIGLKIDRSWHSIQTHCLKLQLERKIEGFKVGNMNLWVKASQKKD